VPSAQAVELMFSSYRCMVGATGVEPPCPTRRWTRLTRRSCRL